MDVEAVFAAQNNDSYWWLQCLCTHTSRKSKATSWRRLCDTSLKSSFDGPGYAGKCGLEKVLSSWRCSPYICSRLWERRRSIWLGQMGRTISFPIEQIERDTDELQFAIAPIRHRLAQTLVFPLQPAFRKGRKQTCSNSSSTCYETSRVKTKQSSEQRKE